MATAKGKRLKVEVVYGCCTGVYPTFGSLAAYEGKDLEVKVVHGCCTGVRDSILSVYFKSKFW